MLTVEQSVLSLIEGWFLIKDHTATAAVKLVPTEDEHLLRFKWKAEQWSGVPRRRFDEHSKGGWAEVGLDPIVFQDDVTVKYVVAQAIIWDHDS